MLGFPPGEDTVRVTLTSHHTRRDRGFLVVTSMRRVCLVDSPSVINPLSLLRYHTVLLLLRGCVPGSHEIYVCKAILVVVGVIGVVARILLRFSFLYMHSCFNNSGELKHYHAVRPPVDGDQAGDQLLGNRHRGQPVRVRRDYWYYRRVLG